MKRLLVIALAAVTAFALVGADSTEAKRLGGGRSLGTQRQATPAPSTPNATSPATPSAPAQAVAPKAAPPAPVPAPAAAGASRWLGPIAGLAAGIGLAALFSHLGLSEGFASVIMLLLLVFGAIFLIRMFMARRTAPSRPMQYAGAGATHGTTVMRAEPPLPRAAADAPSRFEPVFSGSTASAPAAGRFPPGFDEASFVQQSTLQFTKLQAAYDAGDRRALADVLTPEMYAEIDREISERGAHTPTEVASIDANVLEVATEGDQYWASVHFTGTLHEDGAVLPKPFDEVWNLVKPVDGKRGWMLAGIRQLA